jgi:hypothetical protein
MGVYKLNWTALANLAYTSELIFEEKDFDNQDKWRALSFLASKKSKNK